jgi:hypothetical protein
MSAPAFILEAETAYSATTPKTTAAFNILQKDVLVTYGLSGDDGTAIAISNSGLALAWVQQQLVFVVDFGWTAIWTHEVTQSRAAVTTTLTSSGGAAVYGGDALLFRGSDGIGASSKTNNASGAPSLSLTTTVANSAIVVGIVDWSALDGAGRTWRTGAGAFTETTYSTTVGQMTCYGGYHADAGPIGTYTVGLTAPGAQKYAIVACEVRSSVPGTALMPRRMRMRG